MTLKIGSWATTTDWTGAAITGIVLHINKRYNYAEVLDISNGWNRSVALDQLNEATDRPELSVAVEERSDGHKFRVYTWREKGKDKQIVTAGCRFHKGIRSALKRWKPTYRVSTGCSKEYKKERQALNRESVQIVKRLTKQLGIKLPAQNTTSETKKLASRAQSSRRSAGSSPASRRRATSTKRKASTRKA